MFDAGAVGADVVGLPAAAELLAPGGQLADEFVEAPCRGGLSRRRFAGWRRSCRRRGPSSGRSVGRRSRGRCTGEVRRGVGSRNRSEYMARPSWLAARKSSRSFPTIAGAVVMASSVHCRLGRTLHCWAGGGGGFCWSRQLRGPTAAGAPVRRRRVAGRGPARRAHRRTRRPARRVRAGRSTPRSSRPVRRPRCAGARARGVGGAGSPACCGLILARREVRNSRTSTLLSMARQYGDDRRGWDALSVHPLPVTSSPGCGPVSLWT